MVKRPRLLTVEILLEQSKLFRYENELFVFWGIPKEKKNGLMQNNAMVVNL